MHQIYPSFESFFSKEQDYQQQPAETLEFLNHHTQEGKPGFLFKYGQDSERLFVREDQLLNPPTQDHIHYQFIGFADASCVALLEKKF